MVLPRPELPPGSKQRSAVVRCIFLLKKRCYPSASRTVSANNDSSTIHSYLILPSPPKPCTRGISPRLSLPSPLGSFVPILFVTLDNNYGCCGGDRADRADDRRVGTSYYGGFDSTVSCFSMFTFDHIRSISSRGVRGCHGSKYTSIWCSGSYTEHIYPWALCCLLASTTLLSKLLVLL